MKFGELIEFRKELYFEGAVQIDWFYNRDKSAMVAENFVFHGKNYFGIDDSSSFGKKRINTVDLVKSITNKLKDENVKVPTLAIADYGTGKSHLAVTMAQLFSGPSYMPTTYSKIISNIEAIDSEAAQIIKSNCDEKNFVIVLNGMRDFNLHSEILRAAQKSLILYGLPDTGLKKLNRALETAQLFFERNIDSSISVFEEYAKKAGWNQTGDMLKLKIRNELMFNDEAFQIVNDVYTFINGQEIRWDEGISASAVLEMIVQEYCGMNGEFDHVVLLFDEFGRYLEYASGVNAAKSGDSALQQIFETIQNADGMVQVINFIQSDIKTYLQRVDQTKNISRYIGRYDGSDKYYISSNLETVFANLIHRIDKAAFEKFVVGIQSKQENTWKQQFDYMNKWLVTKGMWKNYSLFRKVIVEGIYPMHPLSTYMLTQLSDYLQNRSSLTLISQYINDMASKEMYEGILPLVMPEYLMRGDLYVEMLAAEQDGKQASQHCIRYDNIVRKFGDKLSDKSLMVLRSNLILRILRFRTTDYDDTKLALSFASGLSIEEIEDELVWLENEYAVLGYDDHANCFDFMEESNGAHDFKVIKKRLIASANIKSNYINNFKIQEIAGIDEFQSTNFGTKHKIYTSEWQFKQEMYPIEEFTESRAKLYVEEWRNSRSSILAKGKLIWLYVNKDSSNEEVDKVKKLITLFDNKPIVVMLINDDGNKLFEALVEYYVFDTLDEDNRRKYERHFLDGFKEAESRLKEEFESLKKQRNVVNDDTIESISKRIPAYLTGVFEEIYPKSIPFWFDGFVTKSNNMSTKAGTYFCSIIKMLLSGSLNYDSIHNFASDVRNRIDAVLMTSGIASWKCINENYAVIPPENKDVKFIYDKIVNELTTKKRLKCNDVFEEYTLPPYGLSEDIVILLIAVISANLNYCLRFEYNNDLRSINKWKELVVIKDKKIDLNVVKKTILVVIDSGAVVGKFKRVFSEIENNKKMCDVPELVRKLERLCESNEVPEEIATEFMYIKNRLDQKKMAMNNWILALGNIESTFEEALDPLYERGEIYKVLESLEILRELSIDKYFADYGFEFDEEARKSLEDLDKTISSCIEKNMDAYIQNMFCLSVDHIKTFRNQANKIVAKLQKLGYIDYANRVEAQKTSELTRKEEIKARQDLKHDYDQFMKESKISSFVSYVAAKEYLKRGGEIYALVLKYKNTLGTRKDKMYNELGERLDALEEIKNDTEDKITLIWDNLYEISTADDISKLIGDINIVLQRGLPKNDKEGLEDVQSNLKTLLLDVDELNSATDSWEKFEVLKVKVSEKYKDSYFDFDVDDILNDVIKKVQTQLEKKELTWRENNLNLGDETRETIHKWKNKIQCLPGYISDKTKNDIKILDIQADELIKDGKIDDVMFYFNRLSDEEKKECIIKLQALL